MIALRVGTGWGVAIVASVQNQIQVQIFDDFSANPRIKLATNPTALGQTGEDFQLEIDVNVGVVVKKPRVANTQNRLTAFQRILVAVKALLVTSSPLRSCSSEEFV